MVNCVIVAEKESAAGDIAAGLFGKGSRVGRSYQGKTPAGLEIAVTWASGHMYELAPPDAYDPAFKDWNVSLLPIVPPKWVYIQHEKEGQQRSIRAIEAIVGSLPAGGELINACDAEREGELIYRKLIHPMRIAPGTKMSRLWIHSFTAKGVQDAFAKRRPHSDYDPLGESARTRDEADWFLGMNSTRLATRTLGGPGMVLSVGRVQTPTLAMIVDRDEAIKNFKAAEFYEIFGEFPSGRAKFDVTPLFTHAKKTLFLGSPPDGVADAKVFWTKELAKKTQLHLQTVSPYNVKDTLEKEQKGACLPLNLPEAQKKANATHGWSAATTLGVIQRLYEKKLVSYPRTNSRAFPEAERDTVYQALEDIWPELAKLGTTKMGVLPLPDKAVAFASRAFDDSKVDDHYALRPTGEISGLATLEPDEKHMYFMITQAVVMALDEAALFDVMVRTYVSTVQAAFTFFAKGRKVTREGWRRWMSAPPDEAATLSPITAPIEPLKKAEVDAKSTKPPESYTEGTLLSAMEHASSRLGESGRAGDVSKLIDPSGPSTEELVAAIKSKGIGTAATRHEIIKKLLEKLFIEKTKSKLHATEKGQMLIRELRGRSPLITSPVQTAEWEHRLDLMAKGSKDAMTRAEFLDGLLTEFKRAKPLYPAEAGGSRIGTARVALSLLCPKKKAPIEDCGTFFHFPGYPGYRFFKLVSEREISAAEYIEVIQSWDEGMPILLDGFTSKKKGTKFSAGFVLDEAEKRLKFFFPPR